MKPEISLEDWRLQKCQTLRFSRRSFKGHSRPKSARNLSFKSSKKFFQRGCKTVRPNEPKLEAVEPQFSPKRSGDFTKEPKYNRLERKQ